MNEEIFKLWWLELNEMAYGILGQLIKNSSY